MTLSLTRTGRRGNRIGKTVLLATAIVLVATAWLLSGNPLPPAGPIGPTMKTLNEIEPRGCIASLPAYLNEEGSYCVSANLTAKAGSRDAIVIGASNVTLDLGGFTLSGLVDGRPVPGLSAIRVVDGVGCITIRNGNISRWGGAGVAASGASELKIEGLCVTFNAGGGVLTGENSIVSNCIARSNGAGGIAAGAGSIFTSCVAAKNAGSGLSGGEGSLVKDCVSRSNAENGITVLGGGNVTDCTAGKNAKIGIGAGAGATVETCSSSENGLAGVFAENGCTIRGNSVSANTKDGLRVASVCNVVENTCTNNGRGGAAGGPGSGAGILLAGDRNHVERNLATGNAMGIELSPSLNVVVANSAGLNSVRNYPINAVDWYADYVDLSIDELGKYPFLAAITRETERLIVIGGDSLGFAYIPHVNMELEPWN